MIYTCRIEGSSTLSDGNVSARGLEMNSGPRLSSQTAPPGDGSREGALTANADMLGEDVAKSFNCG
jgi:hypothetical protein